MQAQVFEDVFDALSDTPSEAAHMKARAELLSALVQHVKSWDLSQEAAAARLGVTRPRLNDLMRGKLGKFSLDALVDLAIAAGLTLEIRVATAGLMQLRAVAAPEPVKACAMACGRKNHGVRASP